MNYQGDIALGDTIDLKFTTVNTSGVPTALVSGVVSAYVDNNTTEITAGVTLTADFDARTGLNNVRVVASSGNGFATATNIYLVITAGTVGGSTVVGYTIGSFSIGKRPATLVPAYDAAKTAAPVGAAMTLTSAYDPAKTCAQVGSAMTLTAAYDAAKVAASPANVAAALVTYGALKPTVAGATLDVSANGNAGIDWNNIENPDVYRSLGGTYLYSVTQVANVANPVQTNKDYDIDVIRTNTDHLATAMEVDGAVYRYTANALELAPTGSGGGGTGDASQATLLAVKAKTDALPSDPADASDIAASFATTNGKIDTIAGYVDTEVAAIKAKTDQLVFTGGKVDANASLSLVASDLTSIADAILKRDWTAVSGEAAYSLLNAARMLRNVWNTSGGTLTVKKEDGTATAWTRALAVDPTAQPIVGAT